MGWKETWQRMVKSNQLGPLLQMGRCSQKVPWGMRERCRLMEHERLKVLEVTMEP